MTNMMLYYQRIYREIRLFTEGLEVSVAPLPINDSELNGFVLRGPSPVQAEQAPLSADRRF